MKFIKDKNIEKFELDYNINKKKQEVNIITKGKMGFIKEKLKFRKKIMGQKNNQYYFESHNDCRVLMGKIQKNIKSVVSGYFKEIKIVGLGYMVYKIKDSLIFDLGYSHFISFKVPTNIIIKIEGQNIILYSINKEQLNRFISIIKQFRKINPYKGTGILNKDEKIKLKKGKVR